jgi:hypothetical protein
MRKAVNTLLFILFFALQGCGIYSFSGIQIHPEAKSFSIYPVQNKALTINPTLSFDIQQGLIQRLQSQTKLNEQRSNGDYSYKCTVFEYSVKPVGITNANTASTNRFTIIIECVFENKLDKANNFTRRYSVFKDFGNTVSFQSVEQEFTTQIIEEIINKIIQDSLIIW